MSEAILENHLKGRLTSSDKTEYSDLVQAVDRDVQRMGGISNGV